MGVLILCQFQQRCLGQFLEYFPTFFGGTKLKSRLNDSTSIVLQGNFVHFSIHQGHQLGRHSLDFFFAVGFESQLIPNLLGLHDAFRMFSLGLSFLFQSSFLAFGGLSRFRRGFCLAFLVERLLRHGVVLVEVVVVVVVVFYFQEFEIVAAKKIM